jgi:uncharacterized protein
METKNAESVGGFILFLCMALGVFVLMHVALISFLAGQGLKGTAVVMTLGTVTVASLALIHWRRNLLTQISYIIGTAWLGVLFLSLMIVGALFVLNLFFSLTNVIAIAAALLTIFLALGVYNAFMPKVKSVNIAIPKQFSPVNIVQLSDIHMGEIYGPRFLRRVVQKTNRLKPDVVVLTGDLFDGGRLYDGIIDELRGIETPMLFITGNHEIYTGLAKTHGKIKELDITILDEGMVTLCGVQFAGIGYHNDPRNLAKLARSLDPRKPSVLLRHTPDRVDDAMQAGFDVQLSGHTHRGQMWPLSYLVLLQFPIISGMLRKGHFTLYVSEGVGTWGPPFRLGSRSEITQITLTPPT